LRVGGGEEIRLYVHGFTWLPWRCGMGWSPVAGIGDAR